MTASTASCRGVTEAKKPSVDFRKLSLLLTPSSVMLIIDSGSPLIVESRLTPGVLTPGRNVTAFSALRVAVGIRLSWSALSVEATVAVCVLMSSLLLATVIVSLSVPTSSTALTARRRVRRDPHFRRPRRLEALQRHRHLVGARTAARES